MTTNLIEQNRRIAYEWIDAFNKHDLGMLLNLYAQDALHFSPKFYDYCVKQLKKDVILVLNKIDLVPTSVVIAWKNYFETKLFLCREMSIRHKGIVIRGWKRHKLIV